MLAACGVDAVRVEALAKALGRTRAQVIARAADIILDRQSADPKD